MPSDTGSNMGIGKKLNRFRCRDMVQTSEGGFSEFVVTPGKGPQAFVSQRPATVTSIVFAQRGLVATFPNGKSVWVPDSNVLFAEP